MFACPICIPRIVRPHYVHKRSYFNLSFAEVDEVLGSAGQHWREQRAKNMETVWQQEADAELAALEELGRSCRPIDVLCDEGVHVAAPLPGTAVPSVSEERASNGVASQPSSSDSSSRVSSPPQTNKRKRCRSITTG